MSDSKGGWPGDRPGDWQCLTLRDVRLEVRIGVYDAEKLRPQRRIGGVFLPLRCGDEARFAHADSPLTAPAPSGRAG